MYSDQYDSSANVKLTPVTIADIYHRENIDITRRGEFMGIWQVYVKSRIFGAELVSIYPHRGNIEIRKHLYRLVMPSENLCEQKLQIMWTSICAQTDANYFDPNHFVSLVYHEQEVADVPALTEDYTNSVSSSTTRDVHFLVSC